MLYFFQMTSRRTYQPEFFERIHYHEVHESIALEQFLIQLQLVTVDHWLTLPVWNSTKSVIRLRMDKYNDNKCFFI